MFISNLLHGIVILRTLDFTTHGNSWLFAAVRSQGPLPPGRLLMDRIVLMMTERLSSHPGLASPPQAGPLVQSNNFVPECLLSGQPQSGSVWRRLHDRRASRTDGHEPRQDDDARQADYRYRAS